MKKTSTKTFLSLVGSMFLSAAALAQTWCVPTTLIPYDANMPGITHFTLGSINRTSLGNEHGTANNYTLCTETTNLTRGNTYTVTITFTIDAQICPDMNLRVWIDYNQDGQLDDPGETVITANNQLPGTYTGTFTVPSTATLGSTRLRATAKMTSNGGHSLPSPCDIPQDQLGYHGEMEDYNVSIGTTGVNELAESPIAFTLSPNPATEITNIGYTLKNNSNVSVQVFNMVGERCAVLENATEIAGDHTIKMNATELNLTSGIYFVEIKTGDVTETKKLVIRTQ
jgi:hypothetical protein